MKRVMLITNSLTGGGAERSMNLLANEMNRRGWSISLVPVNSSPQDQVTLNCELYPLNRKWRGNPVSLIFTLWKFQRIVQRWKPDVLVLNCDLPELIGALSFGSRNLVVVEHSAIPWIQRKRMGRVIRAILHFRRAKWISVSEHLNVWPNKSLPMTVIPNPLLFSLDPQLRPTSGNINRLLFIGRLSIEKRPELFIKISNSANIDCILIGDGLMRKELQQSANSAANSVLLTGHAIDPWKLRTPGDLLIVPSLTEGDGLVVLEALIRNVPLLVSDIPEFRRFGFPEVNYCQSENDFLSKITAFSQNIDALLVPTDKTVELLRSRDIGVICDKWIKVLDKLV